MPVSDKTAMKVKICGLTNLDDARSACMNGADLLGFLFAEESPRFVRDETVKEIISRLPDAPLKTGLFKDHNIDRVKNAVMFCGLQCVQLHGSESPEYCDKLRLSIGEEGGAIKIIKTFKVSDRIIGARPDDYESVDYYLFDTYHPQLMGGTGHSFDWNVLAGFSGKHPFFLAGGLSVENVSEAIEVVKPFGVDIASGVEIRPGKKDPEKIKEFIQNAKRSKSA